MQVRIYGPIIQRALQQFLEKHLSGVKNIVVSDTAVLAGITRTIADDGLTYMIVEFDSERTS